MFITDSVIGMAWDGFLTWIYAKAIEFLNEFFSYIGTMGAEVFELSWIQAIVKLFSNFGITLFLVGFVVSVFDCAIEYQNGKAAIRDTALNTIKGLMAANLFAVLPVELYKFSISLQGNFGSSIAGLLGAEAFDYKGLSMEFLTLVRDLTGFFALFLIIMVGYCIIKVFFENIKRGGILIIMIAVGSLYMFSVPRGYTDGFIGWCKQVFALCLTAFLQTILLIAGLITFRHQMILGIGIMLSASEMPRIAGQFGLDTSAKGNMHTAIYSAQSIVHIIKPLLTKGAAA
ncbi:MAG: DUF6045 family protein [Clostridiales bacterium]|jgi:hypothetical protein|nr:DUF6045 family protein [Clostridiales bacterium]